MKSPWDTGYIVFIYFFLFWLLLTHVEYYSLLRTEWGEDCQRVTKMENEQ